MRSHLDRHVCGVIARGGDLRVDHQPPAVLVAAVDHGAVGQFRGEQPGLGLEILLFGAVVVEVIDREVW